MRAKWEGSGDITESHRGLMAMAATQDAQLQQVPPFNTETYFVSLTMQQIYNTWDSHIYPLSILMNDDPGENSMLYVYNIHMPRL